MNSATARPVSASGRDTHRLAREMYSSFMCDETASRLIRALAALTAIILLSALWMALFYAPREMMTEVTRNWSSLHDARVVDGTAMG